MRGAVVAEEGRYPAQGLQDEIEQIAEQQAVAEAVQEDRSLANLE